MYIDVHRYGGFEWCWDAHIWRNTTKTNGTRVFPIWPCHLPVLVDRVAPLLKHLSQTQCGSMLMNVYGQGIHVDSSCLIWMFDLDLSQGLLVQKWPLNSECESFKVTIARGYKASDPKQVWGSSPSKDAAPHDGYSHDAFSSIYTKFHHGGLDLFRGYYTAYIFKMHQNAVARCPQISRLNPTEEGSVFCWVFLWVSENHPVDHWSTFTLSQAPYSEWYPECRERLSFDIASFNSRCSVGSHVCWIAKENQPILLRQSDIGMENQHDGKSPTNMQLSIPKLLDYP